MNARMSTRTTTSKSTGLLTTLTIAAALVSGCAASNPPVASQDITALSKAERYQAAVNAHARANNVEVYWVNLPDEGDLAHYDDSDFSEKKTSGSN